MVQSPSWEANWFAASQEIPSISQNPKVHYRTHKRPPPVSILGQPNPVYNLQEFVVIMYTNCYCDLRLVHWHLSTSYGCGQKETSRKMDNQQLVSPWRQCSSTPGGCIQGLLSKEQCDSTTPSLAPANFHLSPRLKSGMQGRRFCYSTDVIKNATEELKRL